MSRTHKGVSSPRSARIPANVMQMHISSPIPADNLLRKQSNNKMFKRGQMLLDTSTTKGARKVTVSNIHWLDNGKVAGVVREGNKEIPVVQIGTQSIKGRTVGNWMMQA